jgi:Zn-dependent M28 family amino/carboxypeptidase
LKKSLLIAALAAASVLVACGKSEQPAETASDAAVDASNSVNIDGEFMRMIVKEISDDRYEGRGPGSRGDKMARDYLAKQMADIGLQPGGADGSYEQPFDLVGVDTQQPPDWTFDTSSGSVTLKQWDDFIVGSGIQEDRASIEDAELVFAGYGIQAPEYDWDDYKGVDVRGKLLIIMNNDPDWDPELFAGERRLWYGRWDYKYEMAAKLGAAGVLIIHTTPSAGYPFQVLQTSGTGPQFQLPAGDEPRNVMEGWITEDAARELIAESGHDLDALYEAAYNRDFKPVPLGIKTSLGMDVEITRVQSANVLGLIPGSDPELKDEVVIYTAHHDHLGIGTPNDDGDAIYNGAYDNATGVAIVLAIAAAISDLQEAPRRSVLVALVGAEEQGLLGSKYYAANPTFPAGKIAANMNFDGGNIWGHTHDVTFIGFGKSSIDDLVTEYAAEQGRTVQPDQFADRGYFYRSDQFSFAKIGVPAAYLDPGTSFVDKPEGWGKAQIDHFTDHNYHQPSDEYDDSWTFVGAVEDALLGYWTGLAIANADDMPTWNAGDEFEAARLKAIAELEN